MGALISKEHLAKVKSYVALAREEGCSVLCGDGVDQLVLPERNINVSELIYHAEQGTKGLSYYIAMTPRAQGVKLVCYHDTQCTKGLS